MADTTLVAASPRGTSWLSVIGGWIAAVGMAALLAPLVAGAVAGRAQPDGLAVAVPAILGVMLAYLVGGYVAGRMAGYKTSWHGMLAAFFGLFVVLLLILGAWAAASGYLGDLRFGAIDGVYAWGFGPAIDGEALTFGALLGFLATIFAGWLGGLLVPDRVVAEVARPVAAAATIDQTMAGDRATPARTGFRILPSIGRKGGETIERHEHVESDGDREIHETRIDRS